MSINTWYTSEKTDFSSQVIYNTNGKYIDRSILNYIHVGSIVSVIVFVGPNSNTHRSEGETILADFEITKIVKDDKGNNIFTGKCSDWHGTPGDEDFYWTAPIKNDDIAIFRLKDIPRIVVYDSEYMNRDLLPYIIEVPHP